MKCIVSLSGGRDSATCLGLAVERYGAENVYAMGFEYGSTHGQELEAAQKIADYYGVPYQIVNINPDIFKGSTCTMLKGATKEIQKEMSALSNKFEDTHLFSHLLSVPRVGLDPTQPLRAKGFSYKPKFAWTMS